MATVQGSGNRYAQAHCLGCAVEREGSYQGIAGTIMAVKSQCGLRTAKQLWTLNVREEGEEKHHGKANSETDFFPCNIHHLVNAASKPNNKHPTGFKPNNLVT